MDAEYCRGDIIRELGKLLSKRERKVIDLPSFSRAAVLVPLFKKGRDCHILFTKRSDRVKYHKGEISFPGGMVDKEDSSLEKTALREAFEEVGLRETDVQVVGVLDDIVTVSEFVVTPFVGLFPYPYPFETSPVEIAELIEVPLSKLLKDDSLSQKEVLRRGRAAVVDAFQYGDHVIWGATARILKQFLGFISRAGA
jgi:8-oxo-dGTP pyrophosphatase MutT (NUDIX family)